MGAGRFRPATQDDYGHSGYKLEEARRQGAVGAILIYPGPAIGYGWQSVAGPGSGLRLALATEEVSDLRFAGWLGWETAAQVIDLAGLELATLVGLAGSAEFRPVATGLNVGAEFSGERRRVTAANVAGLLRGSDPERAEEVVVVSAGYGGLGIGPAAEGDSIYNGAYEHTSGAALLLCLADAFARAPRRPARSLLFLALTDQAPGGLGSRHYVRRPLVPLAKTVADLGLNRVNLWGPTEDARVLDGGVPEVRRLAEAAAQAEGLRLAGDRASAPGDLRRSGGFTFVRAGVPAAVVGHGTAYLGQVPGSGERRLADYEARHLGRPSDEYRPDIDHRGAIQQGRVAYRLALELGQLGSRPQLPQGWDSGGDSGGRPPPP